MLRIECRCGEVFQADAQHVGRRLRCRCGRTLEVRPPRRSLRMSAPARLPGLRDRLGAAWRSLDRGRSRPHARWMRWAAWGYVGLALAAVIVMWGMGDRSWLGTAVLFGPRWLLLAPLGLLVPAALALRPRSLLALTVGTALVLGPVMGMRAGWQGLLVSAPAAGTLRVASLNAMASPGPALALIHLMGDWDVDIAAIQECRSEGARLLESQPGWHFHQAGGLCLLSRFPIESAEATRWGELDAARREGLGRSGSAVRYRVRTPGGDVQLVNLHLETPRKGLERLRNSLESDPVAGNTVIRRVGSRRAYEWLAPDRDSLIVLGDFNMPVESSIYRETWAAFDNAFSRAGWGLGMTKDNGWIRVRIDHVLLGRAWRARRAWVGPDVGSDHWPVFAELVLRDSP